MLCAGRGREGATSPPSPPASVPAWRADMAGRGVTSGPRAAGMTVYVGATLADVQPMLAADLGILVGPDPEVLEALGLLGVRVNVLVTGAVSLVLFVWPAAGRHRGCSCSGCAYDQGAVWVPARAWIPWSVGGHRKIWLAAYDPAEQRY